MTDSTATSKEKSASVLTLEDFSSRAHLTEKGQISDEYDPFASRDPETSSSSGSALAHLLKSSLGSGILAMPMAFANGGLVFGAVGTLVIGYLCTHCVHILVKTSHSICRDIKVPSLGFAETAAKVCELGPPPIRSWANFASKFVDYGLMATYFAACGVYIVFIATSFQYVFAESLNIDLDVRVYIALTLIPCLAIGQIRTLKWLVPFSAVANVFIVITFGITLYYMFSGPVTVSDKPFVASASKIPLFFATVIFALEGIGVVMPVENSMRKPQQFLGCPGVLNIAMITVTLLYAVIGFFGYARYGDDVLPSITLNLEPGEPLAQTAKVLMALAILFTFGLQFFVPVEILWGKIKHKFAEKNQNVAQTLLRVAIILLAGGISAAIPDMEPFISLVGAVFFSLLGILAPSFIETVYQWPDNLGWCKWILIKNIVIGIIAIFALVSGASASINSIIKLYS